MIQKKTRGAARAGRVLPGRGIVPGVVTPVDPQLPPAVLREPALRMEGDTLVVTMPTYQSYSPLTGTTFVLYRNVQGYDPAEISSWIVDGKVEKARAGFDIIYTAQGLAQNQWGQTVTTLVSLNVPKGAVPVLVAQPKLELDGTDLHYTFATFDGPFNGRQDILARRANGFVETLAHDGPPGGTLPDAVKNVDCEYLIQCQAVNNYGNATSELVTLAVPAPVTEPEPEPVYDPDAAALFARFDTPASPERKQLISDMFMVGKTNSWWAKLDALWVHAAHGPEAGRLNWLSTKYNCLPVNNPEFTVDRGYRGDGVTSYLDTQFNPVTAVGAKYQRDSASVGIRSNTGNSEDGSLAGYWDGAKGTTINPRATNGRPSARVNQAAFSSTSTTVPSSIGMFVANRRTSGGMALWRNGAQVIGAAATSTPLADGNLRLGSISDTSLRACQFCMGFIGGGLDDAEITSIHNWFEHYRIEVGVPA